MTAKPTPFPSWECTSCHKPLGRTTRAGDLVSIAPGTIIEVGRISVVVRCSCGATKAFNGRHIRIDVPDAVMTEAA